MKARGWRIGRWAVGCAVALLALTAVALGAFLVSGWESFGARPTGQRLAMTQGSLQWHAGQFENPQPMWLDAAAAWRRFLFGPATPGAEPDTAVPVVHTAAALYAASSQSGLHVTWLGHSSVLLEIERRRILIDPLWSERASPVGWAGPKRWFSPTLAIRDLPVIDLVVISHDHYDHLDRAAILALLPGVAVFVVPLGVGAHLERWGVPQTRIVELDWWQSTRVNGITVTATPARHKSGRFIGQTNRTLWAGYAIAGERHRIWYSGDTGFHDELARIGERLGPFDVTLIDAGQYDANWPDTHLGPELAVEAHRAVRGKVLIPVHWGLLKLAEHAWTEPIERVLVASARDGVVVRAPRPGERIDPLIDASVERWWPRL